MVYFDVKLKSMVENPLKKLHHMNTATKCVLLPTLSKADVSSYTDVSRNWLTLEKTGCFEFCSNFNLNIDMGYIPMYLIYYLVPLFIKLLMFIS